MTRRRGPPDAQPPRGVKRCAQCGYDHDYQFDRAQAWHEAHDPSIGEAHDAMSLERLPR